MPIALRAASKPTALGCPAVASDPAGAPNPASASSPVAGPRRQTTLSGASVLRVAGLALLQAWVFVAFFSGLMHCPLWGGVERLNMAYVCWSCGIVVVSVVGVLPWRDWAHALRPSAPRGADDSLATRTRIMRVANVAAGVLLLASTFVLAFAAGQGGRGTGSAANPLSMVSAVVAGMSVGALYWSWGTVFVGSFGRGVPLAYGASFALSSLLYAAVLFVPPTFGVVLASVLPLGSVVCLACCSASAHGAMSERRRVPAHSKVMFARSVAAVFLLGFAESAMRALFQTTDPLVEGTAYRPLLPAVTIVAAVVVAIVSRLRTGKDTVGRVNHVVMLFIALAFLLAPILSGLGMWSDAVTLLCHVFLGLFTWTMFTQVACAYRLNVRVTFAVGLGAAFAGSLVGVCAGAALEPVVALNFRFQMLATLVSTCMVFAAFLFIADGRTFVELLDADSDSPSTPSRFQLRCERVAQLYGLTAKELEVMTLVAKGRSVQRIQEALGIAASTVNTHISHIYRKLGVHSRQEMLDMLDRGDA